eukprot:5376870-Prymnesium_polylepis.2
MVGVAAASGEGVMAGTAALGGAPPRPPRRAAAPWKARAEAGLVGLELELLARRLGRLLVLVDRVPVLRRERAALVDALHPPRERDRDLAAAVVGGDVLVPARQREPLVLHEGVHLDGDPEAVVPRRLAVARAKVRVRVLLGLTRVVDAHVPVGDTGEG